MSIVQTLIDNHMGRETFLSEKRRLEMKKLLLSISDDTRK
jgi:hypothetical protein